MTMALLALVSANRKKVYGFCFIVLYLFCILLFNYLLVCELKKKKSYLFYPVDATNPFFKYSNCVLCFFSHNWASFIAFIRRWTVAGAHSTKFERGPNYRCNMLLRSQT